MTLLLIVMFAAVAIIGAIIAAVLVLTRGRRGLLNKEEYRMAWLKIENNLDKNNTATYQFAILSADKLLDRVLIELDLPGDTMDGRLKDAKDKLSNPSAVRAAHKLRNQVAQRTDHKINIIGARRALLTYKKALKELGAI
ncbi:hypothetical protein FWD20_02280 [Candidatus Saccharibacteria bacterium]|nr:hypothetical protein [Candidatus Saccharibacteria bacterium]